MPAATEGPTVALSFANNFWGKEDAGVGPLLERMHAAKQTCDELRSFYSARASIEEEYARKLLSLCRKSLGSQELGTLKTSLDTVRGEVESMAKQHQNNAAQMKTELEEPLAAFAGGMKERRKIVQNGIEKLHKVKQQQTQHVSKTRDRYEQECLKIKGYLAQGHMVMGQEERKNKAKLEKTQISLATSNQEYENAVKALEETTARWNREWKAAADKFQDLEEERLDFTKSSLWTFANISSTVCVSDDASCEKIRQSLENMEVEKDIVHFIREKGTGQEIPDPPKYINFCRGDVDAQSEASEDDAYSVAQFPRSINPLFRSSSPQPSTYESHHDPSSQLAKELGHGAPGTPSTRDQTVTPQRLPQQSNEGRHRNSRESQRGVQPPEVSTAPEQTSQRPRGDSCGVEEETNYPPCTPQAQPRELRLDMASPQKSNISQFDPNEFAPVPHDPYPMDGMTMLCRPNTQNGSDLGSQVSATSVSDRPTSRDERSDYSFSSHEPASGSVSPVKQDPAMSPTSPPSDRDRKVLKKKSGFFPNHSPFRRKSIKEPRDVARNARNTWHFGNSSGGSSRAHIHGGDSSQSLLADRATASPDPIDANADVAINVGDNVLPVKLPGRQKPVAEPEPQDDDPIAQALAELKGVTGGGKQSSLRMSADHYHGIATPAPGAQPFARSAPPNGNVAAGMRGTPPPSYDQPVQRLGVPSPAVTSRAMKETSQKYTQQTRSLFAADRPGSGGYRSPSRPTTRGNDMPRAASPAPPRSASPRPGMQNRAASPNPYAGSQRGSTNSRQGSIQMDPPSNHNSAQGFYRQNSPNEMPRAASPASFRGAGDYGRPASRGDYGRPASRAGSNFSGAHGDMFRGMSPAPTDDGYAGSMRGRGGRPGTSQGNRGMSLYEPAGAMAPSSRQRSKSVAGDGKQYTKDGRQILHFARALYMYQAAIPEELGFGKGDILAVLRHQDDGWWEAEVHGDLKLSISNPIGSISRGREQHSHPHATGINLSIPSSPFYLLSSPPFVNDSSAAPTRAPDDFTTNTIADRTAVTGPSFSTTPTTTDIDAGEAAGEAQAPSLKSLSRLITRRSVLVACPELLVAARRTMELANDAAEAMRSGLATAGKVGRMATGKTAQRMAFTTAAFATVSGFLFAVACGAYVLFYNKYMPDQVMQMPVHLQYGYETNPYGVVSLEDKNFGSYQEYDISVTLNLPRSPANLDRGNFMLALHLLDNQPLEPNIILTSSITPKIRPGPLSLLEDRNILHTSTRPAIVPYTDPLVSLASRLLFLVYHMFVPASETITLVVPMIERLEFRPGSMSPTKLVLDVQAGQTLQVYSVAVTITAQLGGLRWYMHKWWVTSFMVFTAAFWCCEVLFCGLGFLVLKSWLGGSKSAQKTLAIKTEDNPQHPAIKQEGGGDGQHLDDVPMTFPTSSGQPPLRYEPLEAGHTNGVERNTPQADMPPAPGGEADDEYEDAGAQEYEGLGEGDEARDSGIGTSFSERDTVSLRRRTSRGRMGSSGS